MPRTTLIQGVALLEISHAELRPQPQPPPEPRLAASARPRRVNSLTLIDGKSFLATTLAGDISPANSTDVGLFHHDTRYLSLLELRINRLRTVVLSAASHQNIVSQIELTTSSPLVRDNLDLPDNTVHIHREQLLANGIFHDRLRFHNYNLQPVELDVDFTLGADFADVFQVRGMLRRVAGTHFEPIVRNGLLTFAYLGRDERFRRTCIRFAPEPERLEASGAHFHLRLEPRQHFRLELGVRTAAGPQPGAPRAPTAAAVEGRGDLEAQFQRSLSMRRQAYGEWQSDTTWVESSNDLFNRCLDTAQGDFFSLRMSFDRPGAAGDRGEIIAAGIPWFATIFGRDSLIAGYQSLMLHPRLAGETLRYLAWRQGTVRDDWRDEEPGKILHELREGEMTRAGEMPHSPYYGSVDSTPLFLIVLDETLRWTGDDALEAELLPHARRALEWIEHDGDSDGDGFVEYRRRSAQGLTNQGWKDSWDAYIERDGATPAAPLALCEVQGYCFDARFRMARLLERAGDTEAAARLRAQARELARRFEAAFWMPAERIFASALDANKRPLPAVGSNPGHLLWSRILTPERARLTARRLLENDVFSGWGVRTLAASEPAFNPMSYHRGSVWPHDNSLIAMGMSLYGFQRSMLKILTGLFQSAAYFRDLRLPELFVGVQRSQGDEPVHYPVSCSPQAWASGAWFLMLTAALGLRPDARRRELRVVSPALPDWLTWLRLHRLRVGGSEVTLEFSRRGERTSCSVLELRGERLSVTVDFSPRASVPDDGL